MLTNNIPLKGSVLLNGWQLSKLHTFEVAGRHLSFLMAAEELSLTPSAVSHRITSLEEELGFKLFERLHRKVKLTSEGDRIYSILQTSFDLLNKEISEINSNDISGSLVIYSRPSIAQQLIIPQLVDFHNKYPSITLDILTGNENINFNNHNIDLAIYFDDKPPNGLHYQYLMSESIFPVCSEEYAKNHNLFNNPSQLGQCTLLHDRQAWGNQLDFNEWKLWSESLSLNHIALNRHIGFDRSDLSIIAAINNAGIAMGRRSLVNKHIKSGELVTPFPELKIDCPHYYYVVTPSNNQNPRVIAFVNWLKEIMSAE
ncbi:D-serine dehydratase transcriptional activator [Photobacterium marinum]|uniref:D-serine dehydratase transcriptional activator n=1 Tax=Photobacterium marinum TaxID=1056511 RepID=L8JH95_9GAMM|nr:DNA-binding transcriptional regulator DsdC [Photobacterium marinum]ELR66787.1 D-serine dehydratase transcriptional activator [Photobacterium marinum]